MNYKVHRTFSKRGSEHMFYLTTIRKWIKDIHHQLKISDWSRYRQPRSCRKEKESPCAKTANSAKASAPQQRP